MAKTQADTVEVLELVSRSGIPDSAIVGALCVIAPNAVIDAVKRIQRRGLSHDAMASRPGGSGSPSGIGTTRRDAGAADGSHPAGQLG